MKKLILNNFKRLMSIMLTAILFLSTISFEVFATDPKVSIIIPVYNTPENLLRDCLESAKNQTLKDIEIICVDDGSTDGSGKILDEYANSDPVRFKVIHQENAGVSAARDNGMKIAKGEYISFVDSDDFLSENMLESCYKIAVDENADIVKCAFDGEWCCNCDIDNKYEIINGPMYKFSFSTTCCVWAGIYKNQFLRSNNITFNNLKTHAEDVVFNMLCVPKVNKILFLKSYLYHKVKNNISLCNLEHNHIKHAQGHVHNLKILCEDWKRNGYFNNNDAKIEFLKLFIWINFWKQDEHICRRFLKSIDPELLQDDVINQLPVKEKIILKSMMQRANQQANSTKTVEDGIYTISSKLDPSMCLDINQRSKNDKANLQLWQKNGTDAQKFKIQYHSDGYYTIKAMCSGKFIDVSASGKRNGTNIWQYSGNGTDAQKWFIVPDGEGYYCFLPKCNNLCMDVRHSKANDGTNIWCWSLNGSDAQRFKLEKCEPRNYVKVEDVDKLVKNQSDNNVHIFCFTDDGYAMPTCVMLASLLENAGDEKINIHIVSFQDNKMSEQNIKNIEALRNIKDVDFDFVYFDKTRCDKFDTGGWNKAIMVKLYCAELFPNLDRIIWLDSDVIVLKSLKNLYNLDMGDKYLAGIEMYQKFRNSDKRWVNAGIGLYNLKEMRKDNIQKSLLDSAREYATGKNKITHACGGVEEYALTYGMPKDKLFVLPIEYGPLIGFYNATNVPCKMSDIVAMHFGNSNNKPWTNLNVFCANKWWEYALKTNFFDKSSKNISFKIGLLQKLDSKSEKTVEDGVYVISSKLDPNKCLDINQSSKNDMANLQLWQKNGTDAQKFKIHYHSDGYYTIEAICSGKLVDVEKSGKNRGNNIWQYKSNGTDAQKWFIVPDGEGYCFLLPKCSNLCMDVSNSKTNNGTNIWCWLLNESDAQRFKLEKCEDKPMSNKPSEVKKEVGKPRPNKPVKIKKNADKPSSNKPGDSKKSA